MRNNMKLPALFVLAALIATGCEGDRIVKPGDQPTNHPELAGMAVRLQVDVEHGTVQMLPATAAAGARDSGSGPPLSFAILGTNEVAVTASNVVRSAPVNNKVTVTFDAAITNRLTSASLVPSSFPSTTAAAGLILFPFQVTQAVGGMATQVVASADWNGDGSAGSGAPRNFFNDFGCASSSATSDCFRWEQYPAPLGPGETTMPQKVGFTLPKAITSFTVLVVLAADISNDLPAVARIAVTPPSYVMNDGFPAYFSAVAYDALNHPLTWATLRWTSADITALGFRHGGALFSVILGPNQEVHGRKVGQTSFTVSSGGISVVVPVDIQVNTVALVQLYTPDSSITVGDQIQGDARVKDHSGFIIPGLLPTWSTTDPNVITVDQNGLITAVGPGTADVVATAGLQSGRVTIAVSTPPPGQISGVIIAYGIPFNSFIPNVTVALSAQGQTVASVTADRAGMYRFPQAPPGDLVLDVVDPPAGCSGVSTPVTLSSGGSVSADLTLTCTGGLEVRMLSGGVLPVSGVEVLVVGSTQQSGGIFTTGANGEITLSGQPPFAVHFTYETMPAGCFLPAPVSAAPTPGGVNQVVWSVECPGPAIITGKVTALGLAQFDGSTVPIPGATVTVFRLDQSRSVQAGSDGLYLIDPAPIGDVAVLAVLMVGGSLYCGDGGQSSAYQIPGRSVVSIDVAVPNCERHSVSVLVNDISAQPVLQSLDIRIVSRLTGSRFGGTVLNNGQPSSFDILGDWSAFDVSLSGLPSGCQASTASGQALPGGSSGVTLTLECQ